MLKFITSSDAARGASVALVVVTAGLVGQYAARGLTPTQWVYGLTAIAGKIDLSPSKLTEKLAGQDSGGKPRGFTVDELEAYIAATGDTTPVLYLVDKYLRDPTVVRQEAMAQIAPALVAVLQMAEAAGLLPKQPARVRR